jgi:hypothetical protein
MFVLMVLQRIAEELINVFRSPKSLDGKVMVYFDHFFAIPIPTPCEHFEVSGRWKPSGNWSPAHNQKLNLVQKELCHYLCVGREECPHCLIRCDGGLEIGFSSFEVLLEFGCSCDAFQKSFQVGAGLLFRLVIARLRFCRIFKLIPVMNL